MGGQSGQLPTQVLADNLTLYKPEEADCSPTLLLAHPALGSFLRPWVLSSNKKDCNVAEQSQFEDNILF